MGLGENLVGWTSNFMTDRRVKMVVGGQEGDEMEVTTGLRGIAYSLRHLHCRGPRVRREQSAGSSSALFRG